MRLAIIDLGTNSLRFDVFDIFSRSEAKEIHREREMLNLGDELFLSRSLHSELVDRAVERLRRIGARSTELAVDKTIAIGTSALREATDSAEFVARVAGETGILINIVDGGEEAQLIAEGIIANEPDASGPCALIDIGGGSTEVSVVRERKVVFSASIPLGASRVRQLYSLDAPAHAHEQDIARARQEIRGLLTHSLAGEIFTGIEIFFGSSGTLRSLARLYSDTALLSLEKVTSIVRAIRSMTIEQMLSIPGMEASRSPLIYAGAILTEELLHSCAATEIRITKYSLRHGVLAREMRAAT